MSEQKTSSFMQELNLWIDANVIGPIESATNSPEFEEVAENVKKAIRTKVLESYRNGQAAPARSARPTANGQGGRYGR